MTRAKKTRSLKRIHSTKTGSISKLKRQAREAGADRQTGKRVKDRRVLSVYEKFLQDNPEAREQDKPKAPAKTNVQQSDDKAPVKPENKREERPQSLLDQLESKDLKDIY